MTRKKRSRKPGSEGPAVYTDKTRNQIDRDGLQRKKDRKRKGLKSGSRHSASEIEQVRSGGQKKDPRIGSKKPIPLIVEPKKLLTKQERRLNAEQELAMLENDAQLMVLLDRIDAGEKLGAGLQKQVDQKLDRIEQLMKQLGLLDEAPAVAEPKSTAPRSDEDLLDQFENMAFDDFDKE